MFFGIAGLIAGLLLYAMRGALPPILIALFLAYVLDPPTTWLEKRRVPRAVAAAIVFGGCIAAILLVALIVVPLAARDLAAFATELPDRIMAAISGLEGWLRWKGVPIPNSVAEAVNVLRSHGAELAQRALGPATWLVNYLAQGAASALGTLAAVLIVPVLAGYLLVDFKRIVRSVDDLLPRASRDSVVSVATEIDSVLGQFFRGQLTVMIILAVLYAGLYAVAGVRLAIPIGIVAGLLSFIPYVGGGVAIVLALLVSLLDFHSWSQIIAVIGCYAVVQTLEGFVITPKIVGDKVGLSAVWVLIALLVGGELAGFVGVLLAVPVAAVMKILVARGQRWYLASEYYSRATVLPELAEGPHAASAFGNTMATAFVEPEVAEELLVHAPPENTAGVSHASASDEAVASRDTDEVELPTPPALDGDPEKEGGE